MYLLLYYTIQNYEFTNSNFNLKWPLQQLVHYWQFSKMQNASEVMTLFAYPIVLDELEKGLLPGSFLTNPSLKQHLLGLLTINNTWKV